MPGRKCPKPSINPKGATSVMIDDAGRARVARTDPVLHDAKA